MIDGRIPDEIARDDVRFDSGVRFRAMDTSLGRWTKQDPLGYEDGSNTYQATRSNPTTLVDPDGLFPWMFLGAKFRNNSHYPALVWRDAGPFSNKFEIVMPGERTPWWADVDFVFYMGMWYKLRQAPIADEQNCLHEDGGWYAGTTCDQDEPSQPSGGPQAKPPGDPGFYPGKEGTAAIPPEVLEEFQKRMRDALEDHPHCSAGEDCPHNREPYR